jgi:hypothetical protein
MRSDAIQIIPAAAGSVVLYSRAASSDIRRGAASFGVAILSLAVGLLMDVQTVGTYVWRAGQK